MVDDLFDLLLVQHEFPVGQALGAYELATPDGTSAVLGTMGELAFQGSDFGADLPPSTRA